MRRFVVAVCALALIAGACSSSSNKKSASTKSDLDVSVVSSRPDTITGDATLVSIASGAGAPTASIDGKSVSVTPFKKWWMLTGLPKGHSVIDVTRDGKSAKLDIEVFPTTGPVISGPHMPLLACSTEANDLGAPTDKDCSAPTKVDYLAMTSAGLKPIADPKKPPAGVTKVTVNGKSYPFVVRRERGVINRSVYWLDVLAPDGVAPESNTAWNGRLVYRFGGGCGFSFGQGGQLGQTAEAPEFLKAGYAVATATFNTFQTQCNDVLSAETAMMVKEHFTKEFGVPVHTIGEGASGGSIQIHLILQNYPGILDGAVGILPFPDATSISAGVADCGLLNHYYGSSSAAQLTADQKAAINGHAVPTTCVVWENSFLEGVRPEDGCDPKIPKSEIYNPATNRKGIRCDLPDANINQLGRDPKTGFAYRPLDNVGVQYGLQALNDKKITVDQFLDLNEKVGGYDIDGKFVADREVAEEQGIKNTYAKGRVSEGGGDQKVVPLIDLNLYDDSAGDIHDRFRAFSLRERLGNSPNFRIWTRGTGITGVDGVITNILTGGGGAGNNAIPVLDEWLDKGTMPAAAQDNCPGADGKFISGPQIYTEAGPCRDNFPLHGDPRTAAGAPLRNDIIKCQLKPVATSDYRVTLTSAQQARLEQLFPQGVCDWSKPSVGYAPLEGTWLKY
jgi:hypothetical protein